MTPSKLLPPRPSLESLHNQAKSLARDAAAGESGAMARIGLHLPTAEGPPTLRDAQFVIAREYGFPGWPDLIGEVRMRLGRALDQAVGRARALIHDNDVEPLRQLLAEHPALLSWREGGGLMAMATSAYGDAGDAQREHWFTRRDCAELLIAAGAVVTPDVCEGLLASRAKGLLALFHHHRLLPHTLKFLAALGDADAVRAALAEGRHDPAIVNEAFVHACSFGREAVAAMLLDQAIGLDPELGGQIDADAGREAFIAWFIDRRPACAIEDGLWKGFVIDRITSFIHAGDPEGFEAGLMRAPWLLGEDWVEAQARLVEVATLNDREEFISALLGLDPAMLRRPPGGSRAVEFAFAYGRVHLVPLLTRIWPLPDDLPHAAGMGDIARVRQWFDESGALLGDLHDHYPCNEPRARVDLGWEPPHRQHVLDAALAFAVTAGRFEVADFLLERGADIDTRWNTHEPASLLHHLVFYGTYDAMRFVISRGIDMTIRDHRWNATAEGWARHARNDPEMAQWLAEAEQQRDRR